MTIGWIGPAARADSPPRETVVIYSALDDDENDHLQELWHKGCPDTRLEFIGAPNFVTYRRMLKEHDEGKKPAADVVVGMLSCVLDNMAARGMLEPYLVRTKAKLRSDFVTVHGLQRHSEGFANTVTANLDRSRDVLFASITAFRNCPP